MLDFSPWKIFVSLIVVIFSIGIVVYNYFNFNQSWGIKLGLDLQGGTYLVLQADEDVYAEEYTQSLYENIQSILLSNKIAYHDLQKSRLSVSLRLDDVDTINKLKIDALKYDEFLDVSNVDNMVVFKITSKSYNNQLNNILLNSIEIIRNRIDQLGTNEPVIKKQGVNRIVVELPGVDNPDRVKSLLGTTGRLTFHIVDSNSTFNGSPLPIGYKFVKSQDNTINIALKIEPSIYGKNLTNAKLEFQDNKPVVGFSFNTQAGKQFADLTKNNVGKLLAIVIDNKVISYPQINTPITGGSGIISGNFALHEAQQMAILLKSGSLPIPLNIVEERSVGPTLGSHSIKSGIMAAIYGYCLVFLFMMVFYKKLGILANISLIFNVFLVFAMLSLLGATLTLPGVAGIVLTIGMAVDANILVYERFNQEVMSSKKVNYPLAMSNAFKRVFITIFDSNITTLFVALFLFSFGSGPIRGFAITLIIGILGSLFSILFITKSLISMFFLKKVKRMKLV